MVELKYGLFSSFVLFVWMIIEYTLLVPIYYEIGIYLGIVAVLILVIGIFFAIKEIRDKTNFGYITFKDAFKIGTIITFTIAILVVLFIYIYYEYINPGYVNFLAAETEKNLFQKGAGRVEINAAVTVVRYQFGLSNQIIQQLLFIMLGGLAITFVLSMLLKRNPKKKFS